jgi:hypothetical protein
MFRGRDFRKCYGRLGNIRDAMRSTIPWFVTAQRRSILESIHITDVVKIGENLNRPELYYNIIQSLLVTNSEAVSRCHLATKKPVLDLLRLHCNPKLHALPLAKIASSCWLSLRQCEACCARVFFRPYP